VRSGLQIRSDYVILEEVIYGYVRIGHVMSGGIRLIQGRRG